MAKVKFHPQPGQEPGNPKIAIFEVPGNQLPDVVLTSLDTHSRAYDVNRSDIKFQLKTRLGKLFFRRRKIAIFRFPGACSGFWPKSQILKLARLLGSRRKMSAQNVFGSQFWPRRTFSSSQKHLNRDFENFDQKLFSSLSMFLESLGQKSCMQGPSFWVPKIDFSEWCRKGLKTHL